MSCPTVCRGLSEPIGSWKTIPIRRRKADRPDGLSVLRSVPSNRIVPSVGRSRQDRRASGGALAAAALPHQPERLVLAEREAHPVDGMHGLAALEHLPGTPDLVVDHEILDLEHRHRCRLAARNLARRCRRHPATSTGSPGSTGSSTGCQHAIDWPGLISASGGVWVRQMSVARSQRGANGHPSASSVTRGGRPRMALKTRERVAVSRGTHRSSPSVYGCAWAREEVHDRRRLHHLARVHHDDPIAVPGDDPEVVGDEDGAEVRAQDEVVEERQDLSLDRHVERGRRLVGDQESGFAGDGEGDHDPLALATTEPVRVLAHPGRRVGDAHRSQELDRAVGARLASEPQMQRQHLLEVLLDGQHRVERRQRILRDHPDLTAADIAQPRGLHGEDVTALEDDLAAGDLARRRHHLHHRQGRDALARPALTDDAEALAGAHVQTQPLHGVDPGALQLERHVEVPDVEQRGVDGVHRTGERPWLLVIHQAPAYRDVGSRASRSPSPAKLKLKVASAMHRMGTSATSGAICM